MRPFFPCLILLGLAALTALAQQPGGTLFDKFDARKTALEQEKSTRYAQLNQQYLTSLKRLAGSSKSSGNLDAALALQVALTQAEQGQYPRTERRSASPNLARLDASWRAGANKIDADLAHKTHALYGAYDQALARLQRDLTSRENIEAAVEVRTMRRELSADPAWTAARALLAVPNRGAGTGAGPSSGAGTVPIRRDGVTNQLFLFDTAANRPLRQRLVLYWAFEEDGDGEVRDLSGRLNHGQASGSAAWTEETNGPGGAAMKFTFDAGHRGRVDVERSATLDPEEAFTFAAWVNLDPGHKESGFAFATGWFKFEYDDAGGLFFNVGKTARNGPIARGLDRGLWHHIAGSCDGAKTELFVNGKRVGVHNRPPPIDEDADRISIGYLMNGMIDEVMMFDAALTEEQVRGIYQSYGGAP